MLYGHPLCYLTLGEKKKYKYDKINNVIGRERLKIMRDVSRLYKIINN